MEKYSLEGFFLQKNKKHVRNYREEEKEMYACILINTYCEKLRRKNSVSFIETQYGKKFYFVGETDKRRTGKQVIFVLFSGKFTSSSGASSGY